jgi:hypothetical protein
MHGNVFSFGLIGLHLATDLSNVLLVLSLNDIDPSYKTRIMSALGRLLARSLCSLSLLSSVRVLSFVWNISSSNDDDL